MRHATFPSFSLAIGWIIPTAAAQPDLKWGVQLGTSKWDGANWLAPDHAGGILAAGMTEGNLGGPNAGEMDIWLARRGGDGAQMWIVQVGTNKYERMGGLAPDGHGGALIGGSTRGDLWGVNAGQEDTFLARYDGAGARIWAVQFGSATTDMPEAVAPDGLGAFYIAGTTDGDLGGPNAGWNDVYLARYDIAGGRDWLVQFGTGASETAMAAAPDGDGGVFIAGWTEGSLGGPHLGSYDIWLARYSADGDRHWIVQFGTGAWDGAEALTPDGDGGVFIAGSTVGDLGGPTAGGEDIYLARYDEAGHRAWITQVGSSESDVGIGLAPDGKGGVLLVGSTRGSLGGPHQGDQDAVLAGFDAGGTMEWIKQFGQAESDRSQAVVSAGPGGFFTSGTTGGSLFGDFAGGGADGFVARFGTACYADFTGDGALDLFDFLEYVNAFNAGDDAADCDGDGVLDLFDFLCFVNAFNEGC